MVGSSDDENQLVIDEGHDEQTPEKPVKGQRGRPRKVSEAEAVIKDEPMEVVTEDTENDILKPKTRMSRMMASRMAPKSKTWFPNAQDRIGTKLGGANSITGSKLKSPNRIEVKREPKDPDMKVFAVSEQVVIPESFLAQEKIENATKSSVSGTDIKSRLSSLNNLFSKINDVIEKDNNEEVTKEQSTEVTNNKNEVEQKDDELTVSLKEPLPEIVVKDDDFESVFDAQVFANIQDQDDINEEDIEENDLLDVVKSITNQNASSENISKFKQCSLLNSEVKAFQLLQSDRFQEQKALQSVQEVVGSAEKLQHAFKCMAYFCSYTSDAAQDFLAHLNEVHSNIEDQANHRGWLKCSYCFHKLANASYLVNHTIKAHLRHQSYQCHMCCHRETSLWCLLIHQQAVHSSENENSMGFIQSSHLKEENEKVSKALPPYSAAVSKSWCCQQQNCGFKSQDPEELSNHLFIQHQSLKSKDYQCSHCLSTFNSASRLVLHMKLSHRKKSQMSNVIIRQVEPTKEEDLEEEEESDQEMEETAKVENSETDVDGLEGRDLLRCGNGACEFSADNIPDFKDHMAICEFSVDALYLSCFHCQKQSKHVATLVDHLKTHGRKRYSCSLCSTFKHAAPLYVKNHLRIGHNVTQTKIVPVDVFKSHPDKDYFIVMPKNALPKGIRTSTSSKAKDTFAPEEIADIPKISMFRHLIRCSVCDFVTKVRLNLVKHLRLHLRLDNVPFITPVNPVEGAENSAISRMKS